MFGAGPPLIPGPYNNNLQIVQTPGAVVLLTENFRDQTSVRGADEHLRVVERFTRVGPDVVHYEYTIDNPTAFSRPWTAAFTMGRSHEMMHEFTCHEGNYGMLNILRAARFGEREAARPR